MYKPLLTFHEAIGADAFWDIVTLIRKELPHYDIWVQGDVSSGTAGPTVELMGKKL